MEIKMETKMETESEMKKQGLVSNGSYSLDGTTFELAKSFSDRTIFNAQKPPNFDKKVCEIILHNNSARNTNVYWSRKFLDKYDLSGIEYPNNLKCIFEEDAYSIDIEATFSILEIIRKHIGVEKIYMIEPTIGMAHSIYFD
jgi:hypothetical protein